MKLYQIIWLVAFLLLAINVPDYFTCTEGCHFFRDYTKWLPEEEDENNLPPTNPNPNAIPPINPVPPNNDESDSDNSDDEEGGHPSIFDRNEAMVVWSTIFKNQTMLRLVANSVWDKNVGAFAVETSLERINKVRKEFNQELQKIATARLPGIHPEHPKKFPLKMIPWERQANKERFLKDVEELTKQYGELLEILGEMLMPAVKKIYDEKYKQLEDTMVPDDDEEGDIYERFCRDVEQELGIDRRRGYFGEINEARENVEWGKDYSWHFSWEDLIMVVRDNFSREAYRTPLYNSHMFRFYQKEVIEDYSHDCT